MAAFETPFAYALNRLLESESWARERLAPFAENHAVLVELRRREGMPLAEAVIDAGAVRFRPMAMTAAAVIVGSAVILFDPIFQGLAISLMAGEVASLLLSRLTVPVLYYMSHRGRSEAPADLQDVPLAPASADAERNQP